MSDWEIRIGKDEVTYAEDYLINNNPKLAAINGAGRGIAIFIIFVALTAVIFEFFKLTNLLENVFIILAVPLLCFRFLILLTSIFGNKTDLPKDIDEEILPIYSVLIAVYKENGVMQYLINALENFDWPKDKLDIIFLCEEDDKETIDSIRNLRQGLDYRLIILPKGRLKTKPRALQVGLKYVRGEFTTIYDAEDRPHYYQLKEAYNKFEQKGEKLAVVQAPLVTWNNSENWISAQFALDYAIWFRLIIPFLGKYFKTFPLGGNVKPFQG